MSDFLSMFDYDGKTAKVLGKARINTYKDIYLHIQIPLQVFVAHIDYS